MTAQHNNHRSGYIGFVKILFQADAYSVIKGILVLLVLVLLLPQRAFAECKEFKIVEDEDKVEAVCVGEPMTEAERKAFLEEEKRQAAAAQRQRSEEQRRQKDSDTANKAQAAAKAAEESKKRTTQPAVSQKPVNKNTYNPNNINPNKF